MSSFFTLTLDTQPPASPEVLINGGAIASGSRDVRVALRTADYQTGAHDVTKMRIWGDVDPTADPKIQMAELDSTWMAYSEEVVVRLATGTGRKHVRARLMDDVCNVTLEFSDFIDYDPALPVITVVSPVTRSRISKTAPCRQAMFAWQSSHAFDRYEVRVVPNVGSPHQAGILVGTGHGSTNVSADGTFAANTAISTVIDGADLEAASPGDGSKVVKVFVRSTTGVWSP